MPENDPPKTSTRLWSEECGIAEADSLPAKEIAYQWSNGREFEKPTDPYA